jgi:hypothetical protein
MPENESHLKEDVLYYDEKIGILMSEFMLMAYKKITTHRAILILLLLLAAAEILMLLFGLSTLAEYALVSTALSALFATLFAYLILRLYTQAKKNEQIKDLLNTYIGKLQTLADFQDDHPECNIFIANGCCKLADVLKDQEYSFFKSSTIFSCLRPLARKLSYYCYWQDIAHMRESLLQSSITEQIKWVKSAATDVEAHLSLANAYVLLSRLYSSLSNQQKDDAWITSKKSVTN